MNELNLATQSTKMKIEEQYPENKLLMIYLTGSRLYGYHSEDSDYDLIAYVMPTEKELVFGDMISTQLKVGENKVESVTVKDVRLIVKDLQKPNLTTLIFLINPLYKLDNAYVDELLYNISVVVKHTTDVNRKNLAMSLLGAVRSNKNSNRAKLMLTLYFLSEFIKEDNNLIDMSVIHGIADKASDYNELPNNFSEMEKELFDFWVKQPKKKDFFVYEDIILNLGFVNVVKSTFINE